MSATSTHEATYTSPSSAARPELWRLALSILLPTGWLSFTLLYVGFLAPGFSLFQSIIVILVSLIILAGTLGTLWLSYGVRHRFAPS